MKNLAELILIIINHNIKHGKEGEGGGKHEKFYRTLGHKYFLNRIVDISTECQSEMAIDLEMLL